jgi:predicted nucleotidyltransferase
MDGNCTPSPSPPLYPGRFHELSPEGWIVNDCSQQRPACWNDPIALVIQEIRERLGDKLHSVYLRGSLARGTAVHGIADLDMLVVYEPMGDQKVDWTWRKPLNQKLIERFTFCKELDINFLNRPILLAAPVGAAYRFMLKTQSICILGDDVIPSLPQFKPDRTVMFSYNFLEADILKAERGLELQNEAHEFCRWIMRRVVRAAGEVAMMHDGRFTRDLGFCVENYLKHRSNAETDSTIPLALELALEPISDRDRVLEITRRAHEELKTALKNQPEKEI